MYKGVRENLHLITDRVERALGQRLGMPALLGVGNETFAALFEDLEEVVLGYNYMDEAAVFGHRHTESLRRSVPKLRTPVNLLRGAAMATCVSFDQALHTMEPLMERGESDQPEPNVSFAVWRDTTAEERLLGGMLQAYGLTITHLNQGNTIPEQDLPAFLQRKDILIDALLEVSVQRHAEGHNSSIYELSAKQGWFDAQTEGVHVFSDHTRSLTSV